MLPAQPRDSGNIIEELHQSKLKEHKEAYWHEEEGSFEQGHLSLTPHFKPKGNPEIRGERTGTSIMLQFAMRYQSKIESYRPTLKGTWIPFRLATLFVSNAKRPVFHK
jgi:hypothetical protein